MIIIFLFSVIYQETKQWNEWYPTDNKILGFGFRTETTGLGGGRGKEEEVIISDTKVGWHLGILVVA